MRRILLVAAAAILTASFAYATPPENAYLWVHPKLGPIWVDKTTNALIRSAPAVTAEQKPKPERKSGPGLWIDPKGNARRFG